MEWGGTGGGGKPSFPSPSAGDLRELPGVPLRGEAQPDFEVGKPLEHSKAKQASDCKTKLRIKPS